MTRLARGQRIAPLQRQRISRAMDGLEAARTALAAFATDAEYVDGSDTLARCCDVLDALDGHCKALAEILERGVV